MTGNRVNVVTDTARLHLAAMEPGRRDREQPWPWSTPCGVVAVAPQWSPVDVTGNRVNVVTDTARLHLAAMEPGRRDREQPWPWSTPCGVVAVAPQWSPVDVTGNSRTSLRKEHEHVRRNGARST